MSRSKDYQKILNSKKWKELRVQYLQQHPLCEICEAKGYVSAAIDLHHKIPVESAKSIKEMERLAYDWNNLQALCIKCHIEVHKLARSHTPEAHKQREDDRLARRIARLEALKGKGHGV